MPIVSVKCPYCRTIIRTSCATSVSCTNRDCKATLHIGYDGKITRSKPNKKK